MSISKLLLAISAVSIILLLTVPPGLAEGPPSQPPPPFSLRSFIPGEVVVKFQPHVSMLGAQGSLRTEGLQALKVSPRSGLVRVRVPPGREAETITTLMARGDVEFATLNRRVEALDDPNDPSFGLQWALKQIDDHDIDAPEAWDLHTGSHNVTIAIIDTGVDLDHPDLQANIVAGYDFVNNDNNPDDDHGHGTHVAGIAAAVGNNGVGIAGVNWTANIMPLKVLDASGSGYSADVADAIYYAVDNGARVINMSLGTRFSQWPCGWVDVEAALDYAVSHQVLVVIAAGNDGQNGVNCPAAYDQAMAVGSTTSNDTRSSFSNYGSRLDIAAPGSSIYSTLPGSYGTLSGTSMATPHVAGLAALLWSYAPSLSSSQVRNIIETTADDLGAAGWDQFYGYGRINAWRALSLLSLQISPQVLTLFIDDTGSSVAGNIQIGTANPNVITWTATISPAVSWLNVSPPTSGNISTASSPANLNLVATKPGAYNTYVTTIVITGTTASGTPIGPQTTTVELHYVPKIYKYHLPLIFKN